MFNHKILLLTYIKNKKNTQQQGITILELLIVFIIIGILAAIALPSVLSQSAKAKQSEAKTYLGAINRAQQTFRMEEGTFAANMDELNIELSTSTNNYLYTMNGNTNQASVVADPMDNELLKGYSGLVFVNNGALNSILCQTQEVNGQTNVQTMNFTGSAISCNSFVGMESFE